MIHGGSHILFSRKDIRPPQTRLMLQMGFLPVSLDHRHCPELRLAEGPMVDICDALEWARAKLPGLLKQLSPDTTADPDSIVVVGWSSGGQLALSTGWTAPARGIRPPKAILGFYCPTDYEDKCEYHTIYALRDTADDLCALSSPGWQQPIQPIGAEDHGETYDVLDGVEDEPVNITLQRTHIKPVSNSHYQNAHRYPATLLSVLGSPYQIPVSVPTLELESFST